MNLATYILRSLLVDPTAWSNRDNGNGRFLWWCEEILEATRGH